MHRVGLLYLLRRKEESQDIPEPLTPPAAQDVPAQTPYTIYAETVTPGSSDDEEARRLQAERFSKVSTRDAHTASPDADYIPVTKDPSPPTPTPDLDVEQDQPIPLIAADTPGNAVPRDISDYATIPPHAGPDETGQQPAPSTLVPTNGRYRLISPRRFSGQFMTLPSSNHTAVHGEIVVDPTNVHPGYTVISTPHGTTAATAPSTADRETAARMYFMDSPTEGQRLERKTDTIQVGEHLLRSGLRLGMLALDIACGTGAVTRVMAKITGPGCTTGIDMSAGRIAQARQFADAEKLSMEFVDGFADQIPFPDNTFDFTHARFLFEYLPNPLEVLAEMRRVTRLGGLVVVSDLDGQINSLYPMSEQLTSEVQDALSILSRTGFDPQVGRKLLHWFAETGLEDTTLSVIPYQVYSGNLSESDIANWQDKLATSVAFLVKQTGDTARWNRFRQNYLTALLAPDAFYYSTIITARGHAPKTQNGQIPFTEVD